MSEIREILKQVYQSGYDDGVNAKYGIRTKAHLIPDKEREIIKIILDEIEKCENPYYESVFIEPTKEELLMVSNFLESKGLTLDKFSGAFGRKVWNKVKQELKQRIKEWEYPTLKDINV